MTLLDPFVSDVPSTSHLWKRHVKEDVVDIEGKQIFPERKSTTVDMELKNSEREIHRMLDEYISNKYEEVRSPQDLGAVRFFATILRKRATSSLRSLRSTLERRREKIGTVNARKTADPDDMENDSDYEDRAGDYEYVYTGGDVEREKIRLAGMISAIDEIGETDSKFDNLVEYVEKVKSGDAKAKILLFTEYRDTLEYLGRQALRKIQDRENRRDHGHGIQKGCTGRVLSGKWPGDPPLHRRGRRRHRHAVLQYRVQLRHTVEPEPA